MQVYGVAPDVRVAGDVGAVLPYIPSHLDYMLFEVSWGFGRAGWGPESLALGKLLMLQTLACGQCHGFEAWHWLLCFFVTKTQTKKAGKGIRATCCGLKTDLRGVLGPGASMHSV